MVDTKAQLLHAVVPAAGRGVRFLPITKAIPKEMLPVAGKPAIEYIVDEAAGAGITQCIFVTRAGKEAIYAYFDEDPSLEADLKTAGNEAALAMVAKRETPAITSVPQDVPLGLGHAVLQARQAVGSNPFAVMLPDDLMAPGATLLRTMIDVRRVFGGSVLALIKVSREQATAYASTAVTPIDIPAGVDLQPGNLMRVDAVVEKPSIDNVLSEYAVVGRYVFDPVVFDFLDGVEPGRNGEYQLTDAYAQMIDLPPERGGGVYGVVVNEPRFDTGDMVGYIEANISLALENEAIAPKLREFLRTKVGD